MALLGDTAPFLKPAGDRRILIKPWLATSAAAPYIARPPLPPALRRSG